MLTTDPITTAAAHTAETDLGVLAAAFAAAGWTVTPTPAHTPDARPWAAHKGLTVVDMPAGDGGRCAASIRRVTYAGDTEYAVLATPSTPPAVLLALGEGLSRLAVVPAGAVA